MEKEISSNEESFFHHGKSSIMIEKPRYEREGGVLFERWNKRHIVFMKKVDGGRGKIDL